MKRLYARSLVIFLCVLVAAMGNARAPQSDDVTKILALENLWNQMQLGHDVNAMQQLLDEDFVLTDYDGSLLNRTQFLASVKDPAVQLATEMSEGMKLHEHGSTVVVTGATREKGTQNGKPFAHNGRFTDTWIRKDGRWVCIASHLGVIAK